MAELGKAKGLSDAPSVTFHLKTTRVTSDPTGNVIHTGARLFPTFPSPGFLLFKPFVSPF